MKFKLKSFKKDGFERFYGIPANQKIVNAILKNPFYYGLMHAPKWDEFVQGQHKPITDEETWKKAHHYLIDKKKTYRSSNKENYPLKGTLKCEFCNHPLTTSPSRGNGG